MLIFVSLCGTICSAFQIDEKNYAVINDRKIFLAIADTPQKQAQGLMYIKQMPENYGMIFLFNRAEPRSFWMKNVKIPLDIIFIRKQKIINIHKNVPVDRENKGLLYKSAFKSDSAIEVNGGFCDRYNVKPGDLIYLSPALNYKWAQIRETGNE